jgi:glycosyltransferase involved in cell wall biosynthesis
MPSKLCSILATGTPVLAICEPYSELTKIVMESNCGFAVSHENINEVTDFIKKLRNDKSLDKEMRKNARILFEKYFTKKTAIENYIELINNMNS